jgi:cytochrome c-type biogenesis protein
MGPVEVASCQRTRHRQAMNESGLLYSVALPIFFGLFGFIEPCSIASTLIMVKQIEGRSARDQQVQMLVFAATRALFIGLLGLLAAAVGSVFLGWQRAAWLLLGTLYVVLGLVYLGGRAGALMHTLGPRLQRLRGSRGALALGLVFGLNIPACAAPLLLALLGLAAAGGASTADLVGGFVSLALFGLALSLPLVLAVFFAPARALLDRLAALSRRMPRWTGAVLILLGAWAIGFALLAAPA